LFVKSHWRNWPKLADSPNTRKRQHENSREVERERNPREIFRQIFSAKMIRSALKAGSSFKQGAKVSETPPKLQGFVGVQRKTSRKSKVKNSEKKRLFNHLPLSRVERHTF
jgi:hypothetical protein